MDDADRAAVRERLARIRLRMTAEDPWWLLARCAELLDELERVEWRQGGLWSVPGTRSSGGDRGVGGFLMGGVVLTWSEGAVGAPVGREGRAVGVRTDGDGQPVEVLVRYAVEPWEDEWVPVGDRLRHLGAPPLVVDR